MSTAVRRALYGKLAADTTLNNLLAAPAAGYSKAIYHNEAPEGSAFPFVIINQASGVATEAMGDPSALETFIWQVKGVDRSTSADVAESIAARIVTLLNDAQLSISGVNHLYLRRRDDSPTYPETIDGVRYQHAGSLFRLVTD